MKKTIILIMVLCSFIIAKDDDLFKMTKNLNELTEKQIKAMSKMLDPNTAILIEMYADIKEIKETVLNIEAVAGFFTLVLIIFLVYKFITKDRKPKHELAGL